MFEKLMQTRLLEPLSNNKILSIEQYQFRTILTRDKATYKLTKEILNVRNSKLIVGGIFCSLEKAFSLVNHDILLPKLEFYGITDTDNILYTSYLSDSNQRLLTHYKKCNHSTLSKRAKITHGISWGSIVGPLHFLLYMSYL
jgi:hypothetical protein